MSADRFANERESDHWDHCILRDLTGLLLANMFLMMMIGEINRKKSEEHLISYFGFTYTKLQRVYHEYRLLYPNGNLLKYYWISFALGVIGIIGVAVCVGSIR